MEKTLSVKDQLGDIILAVKELHARTEIYNSGATKGIPRIIKIVLEEENSDGSKMTWSVVGDRGEWK